jgi:glycopeptide antibiotics resistance protein
MRKSKVVVFIVFVYYLVLASGIIFFKNLSSPLELFSPERLWVRGIDLIPFHDLGTYLNNPQLGSFIAPQLWANVVIMIPLGFCLTYFQPLKPRFRILGQLLIICLSIESLQFILGLGISDIDDILLNFTGGALGLVIYYFTRKLIKNEPLFHRLVTISSAVVGTLIFILNLLLLLHN